MKDMQDLNMADKICCCFLFLSLCLLFCRLIFYFSIVEFSKKSSRIPSECRTNLDKAHTVCKGNQQRIEVLQIIFDDLSGASCSKHC